MRSRLSLSVLASTLATLAILTAASPPVLAQAAPEEEGSKVVEAPAPNTVTAYGAAADHGPGSSMSLAEPVTAMAATPKGGGYWLAASDGGVFSFGDARFLGSMGGVELNQRVVGMAATPKQGYWLVSADGGIFSFGDAGFHGSMGEKGTDRPVVGIAASPEGDGYWLASEDGQVYAFGVLERGSAAEADREGAEARTVAIAAHPGGDGYWLAQGDLPVVEIEDTGPHVAALQRKLRDMGYWVGTADGVYGKLTEQAVYAFQKYEGLPVDGVVTRETRLALSRASRPVPRRREWRSHRGGQDAPAALLRAGREDRMGVQHLDGHRGALHLRGAKVSGRHARGAMDHLPGDRRREGVSNLGRLVRPKYFHADVIAIHGYSFVPPYPVSHGCVRVTLPAIDFIWANGLAPIGAQVWVYGTTPDV